MMITVDVFPRFIAIDASLLDSVFMFSSFVLGKAGEKKNMTPRFGIYCSSPSFLL